MQLGRSNKTRIFEERKKRSIIQFIFPKTRLVHTQLYVLFIYLKSELYVYDFFLQTYTVEVLEIDLRNNIIMVPVELPGVAREKNCEYCNSFWT